MPLLQPEDAARQPHGEPAIGERHQRAVQPGDLRHRLGQPGRLGQRRYAEDRHRAAVQHHPVGDTLRGEEPPPALLAHGHLQSRNRRQVCAFAPDGRRCVRISRWRPVNCSSRPAASARTCSSAVRRTAHRCCSCTATARPRRSGSRWCGASRRRLRVVAPDLRGYGGSETAPVDATRGLRDFADDVAALLDDRELFPRGRPGRGGRALDGLRGRDAAARRPPGPVLRGPAGGAGQPVRLRRHPRPGRHPDHRRLRRHRRRHRQPGLRRAHRRPATAAPTRRPARWPVLRSAYVADPASLGADEDAAAGHRAEHGGRRRTTTRATASRCRTGRAIGARRPRRAQHDGAQPLQRRRGSGRRPRRSRRSPGSAATRDAIVSDTSLFDLAYLGSLGLVPGWPGAEACPPQPMVGQTRAVLERYAAAGGAYREVVYDRPAATPRTSSARPRSPRSCCSSSAPADPAAGKSAASPAAGRRGCGCRRAPGHGHHPGALGSSPDARASTSWR